MSLKKIGQIKEGKWFRVWDLIVYGVIAALLLAIVLAVCLTRDGSPADGVKISYKGVSVFEYDYQTDGYEIKSVKNIEVKENGAERLTLTFYTDGKSGYNTIVIDKSEKSVKVTDANCSTHRDCVYTPAITDNGSVIHCPPHSLAIEPLTRTVDPDDDIIIG